MWLAYTKDNVMKITYYSCAKFEKIITLNFDKNLLT